MTTEYQRLCQSQTTGTMVECPTCGGIYNAYNVCPFCAEDAAEATRRSGILTQGPQTLATYAATWHRDPANNFAVACSDQNSTKELTQALRTTPDATDMATWGITDP